MRSYPFRSFHFLRRLLATSGDTTNSLLRDSPRARSRWESARSSPIDQEPPSGSKVTLIVFRIDTRRFQLFDSLNVGDIELIEEKAAIALQAAAHAHFSLHAPMMAVALAAASAFNSPVSHPANVLIMSPGGHRFADFPGLGLPVTLVLLAVLLLVLPWMRPLRALWP